MTSTSDACRVSVRNAVRALAALLVVGTLAVGCSEKKREPPVRPITGVKDCDVYLTSYETCLAAMRPGPQRQEAENAYHLQRRELARVARSSWRPETKAAFVHTCRQAFEEFKPQCSRD
jgi:hypothetical protein